ncbi:cell death abnormality protein 1-like [Haliotis rufescens]|uniref:cell death abnormality protein 1-like n=1 Tax=Haliotis rufescens TaxID=6454 RepID=UPI00201EB81B|nr:cell death abnormality protein 1-like [Haliotis rufescens]
MNCGQPGIDENCRRTCGRCNLTDCAVGMYRNGDSCTACQRQSQDDHDECTRTCLVTGRWGEACDRQCGDSCQSLSCYQWSGECVHGCTEGRYGRLCDLNCDHCGLCGDGVSNCARGDGSCICGCRGNVFGVKCDKQCDNNCLNTSCNSTTGACTHGCKQGLFGKKCNTYCSDKCLHGTCYQNGSCIACVKGHYGKECREKCSRNCGSETCSRDGSCSPCNPGYFKTQCQEKCSDTCLNRTCSQNNGTCYYGCVSDWHGDTCAVKCPENCATDKCSRDNGSCADGCIDGSYGQHCNLTCSSNCTDMKCSTTYPGGSKPACTLGCKDGVWGDYCDSECPDHCTTCNRRTGTCLKFSYVQSLHRVIVVLSACLGVLLLVIAVIIARKRECAWCKVFQRGIYLSPSSPDSRPGEISLQEFNGSRDSEGSRYAVIPDMNNDSSVEERGYEQLNLPPPDTGYTPLSHTCQ